MDRRKGKKEGGMRAGEVKGMEGKEEGRKGK